MKPEMKDLFYSVLGRGELYDKDMTEAGSKVVVFTKKENLLSAMNQNAEMCKDYTERMKHNADEIRNALNILGSMERVTDFLYMTGDVMQDEIDKINLNDCIAHDYVDYCLATGNHFKEIAEPYVDEFLETISGELVNECNDKNDTALQFLIYDADSVEDDTELFIKIKEDETTIDEKLYRSFLTDEEYTDIVEFAYSVECPEDLMNNANYRKAVCKLLEQIISEF